MLLLRSDHFSLTAIDFFFQFCFQELAKLFKNYLKISILPPAPLHIFPELCSALAKVFLLKYMSNIKQLSE